MLNIHFERGTAGMPLKGSKMLKFFKFQFPKEVWGIRLVPIFETIFFLLVLIVLDTIWGKGDRFIHRGMHPFWVIVLLISAQYGFFQGLIAAFLSILFLYVGNLPPIRQDEPFFQYDLRISFLPLLWILAAVVIGKITDNRISQQNHLREELHAAKRESGAITKAYENMKQKKDSFEVYIAGLHKTAAMIFNTFLGIEQLKPVDLLYGLGPVVESALHPKKYSVYSFGPNGFETILSYGWTQSDQYLRRIESPNPLFEEIAEKKRLVCLVNHDDKIILNSQGVLAAPFIDPETKQIFGMLKIEEIEFFELNFSNIEIFKMICELVGQAYSNAQRFQKMKVNVYDHDLGLYSHTLFDIQSNYLKKICQTFNLPLSYIKISYYLPVRGNENLSKGEREEILKKALQSISPIAEFFAGRREGRELLILIPCPVAEAQKLGDAFCEEGNKILKNLNGQVSIMQVDALA